LFGKGFLCEIGPTACPAIAIAASGDRVEFSGSGTFDVSTKAASGGGVFTHKNSLGAVLESGTWTATGLLSFKSFGTQPDVPPNFVGGHALIRAELHTASGATLKGIVTIFCVIGKVPGDKTEDVDLLNIQGVINFDKVITGFDIASGANIFIQL
jgi:hypothetical protein